MMRVTRRVALGTSLTAACLLIGLSTVGVAQRGMARKPLVDAEHKRMQPEDAQGSVLVFGDPSKPGMYIQRNRFGPGQTSRPHFHDQDRWVTVIKGTWYTGEGDVFQPDKMVPIREGGLMFHPAGFHHYDGAKPGGDEEVIVQIMGMGPVKTTQTEVDANGNPVQGRGRQ
jgi:hypothetical protein